MQYSVPEHYFPPVEQSSYDDRFDQGMSTAGVAQALPFSDRPRWIPLAFLPPVAIAALSWASNGIPMVTDTAFTLMCLVCAFCFMGELLNFARRFGIGGFLVFGGVLVWFAHDYYSNWFGRNFTTSPFPPVVIAKAVFLYCLFIMLMAAGLMLPSGRRVDEFILKVPDFPSSRITLLFAIVLFVIGISPYFWDTREPFYEAIWKALTAGRSGGGPHFIWGRTGNTATGWGSYIGKIIDLGSVAGMLGVAYAILQARSLGGKALGWGIWLLEVGLAFGSGARGAILEMLLPMVGLIFIRYNALAASYLKRFSVRGYVMLASLLIGILILVQIQITFRHSGFDGANLGQVEFTKAQGNLMFSEALKGYSLIPERHTFFHDSFPGETIIRPLPEYLFLFVTHPIPRVLWPDKPIDQMAVWYAYVVTGEDSRGGTVGTTISRGLVGSFYFNYGLAGVIEGGLLVGWLMGLTERWLRVSDGRLLPMLTTLGIATWLFRSYRDFLFAELWNVLLGIIILSVVLYVLRPILGTPSHDAV